MDEFKKIAKKIFVGIGINKNHQLTAFCNLQSPGINPEHSFNLKVDNTKSAKLEYSTPKISFKIFKNESNPLKIPNHGIGVGNTNLQTILAKFNDIVALKLLFNHRNGEHTLGVYDDKSFFLKNIFKLEGHLDVKNLFYKVKSELGTIFGNPMDVDKFFLESIRGYKNGSADNNGYSFIRINQALGCKFRGAKFFVFNDIGLVSEQNDMFKTAKYMVELVRKKETDINFLWSLGVGITPPIKLAGKDVSGILALPVTNSENKVQFTLEAEI